MRSFKVQVENKVVYLEFLGIFIIVVLLILLCVVCRRCDSYHLCGGE